MKKIKVRVCLGTTCFVMGSSILQNLSDIVPKKFGNKVEVTGSGCLGVCSTNWEHSKAPYVKVNDILIQEATAEKVVAEIESQLSI